MAYDKNEARYNRAVIDLDIQPPEIDKFLIFLLGSVGMLTQPGEVGYHCSHPVRLLAITSATNIHADEMRAQQI
jgi:hypothetical protein